MIPVVTVSDPDGVLSDSDRHRLGTYVIHNCRSSIGDRTWLKHIEVRPDARSGYLGYWAARFRREGAIIAEFQAIIVLNSWYLKRIEDMEDTLAHEYGHNWTLGHLILLERIEPDKNNSTDKVRVPWIYYRMRQLDPKKFVAGVKQGKAGWYHCDKEVLAEDYRVLFTNCNESHAMAHLVGLPSTEVAEYIKKLNRRMYAHSSN